MFNASVQAIMKTEQIRTGICHAMISFFEKNDFLICPAASVAPFPVEKPFVTEINGQPFTTHIDWFSITFLITINA